MTRRTMDIALRITLTCWPPAFLGVGQPHRLDAVDDGCQLPAPRIIRAAGVLGAVGTTLPYMTGIPWSLDRGSPSGFIFVAARRN